MGPGRQDPDQAYAGLSDEPPPNGADRSQYGRGKKQLVHARWGLPSPIFVKKKAAEARADKMRSKWQAVDMDELTRMEPDRGVTNVRKLALPHWKRWFGVEHRCIVPVTSFAEPDPSP